MAAHNPAGHNPAGRHSRIRTGRIGVGIVGILIACRRQFRPLHLSIPVAAILRCRGSVRIIIRVLGHIAETVIGCTTIDRTIECPVVIWLRRTASPTVIGVRIIIIGVLDTEDAPATVHGNTAAILVDKDPHPAIMIDFLAWIIKLRKLNRAFSNRCRPAFVGARGTIDGDCRNGSKQSKTKHVCVMRHEGCPG